MRFQLGYEIGQNPLKTVESINLLRTDRCIVNVSKDTLALPIMMDDETKGYFFHGAGELLIDTIIETPRGAVGEPTDKDLTKPFIMIGETKGVDNKVEPADASDLLKKGHKNCEDFIEKAQELCRRVFRRRLHSTNFNENCAQLFVFAADKNSEDVLVSKGDKLVYKSQDDVCVFKGEKGVLKKPGEIVVSRNGKMWLY